MLDLSCCADADLCAPLASRVGSTFLAVLRVGGIFFAEAVKPNYGGTFSAVMQYGGNFLAVGGFSFFGGNDFGGGGNTKNMAVAILPGPHQGDHFTARKIPRTTLEKSPVSSFPTSRCYCTAILRRRATGAENDFFFFSVLATGFRTSDFGGFLARSCKAVHR